MNDLCMFILYLVSITQVLKDTSFGLYNWCECGNLFIIYLLSPRGLDKVKSLWSETISKFVIVVIQMKFLDNVT
jgi:hypothetical protein